MTYERSFINFDADPGRVETIFAESEVINQLSLGSAPSDILHGAIVSLLDRSLQIMKRVRMEPEFTLIGGILRFPAMRDVARRHIGEAIHIPPGDLAQFVPALGAALLGRRRLEILAGAPAAQSLEEDWRHVP